MEPPQFPAGPFAAQDSYDDRKRTEFIAQIEGAPALLRRTIAGLSTAQLDTRYKNWTVRQIVHHLPDSHVNAYVRFKLTLTEDVPTIRPYQEGRWAELADARAGDVGAPLAMLDGVHQSWVQLLRAMTAEQFARRYFHPESGQEVALATALASYVWHCKHHIGQIAWLCDTKGWK
jgi:hypothetical protein